MSKKLTIEHVRAEIEKRGGTLLSEVYVNNRTKMRVKCGKNHIWEVAWEKIQQNRWCPYCAGNVRLTIEEIREFVESKNGILLSTEYKNNSTNLHIKCNVCEYEWYPTTADIKDGCWCPKCAGHVPPTIEEIREFVESKNGTLLSEAYIDSKTPLDIICNICLHRWIPCWNTIQQGCWCAKCAGHIPPTIEEIREFVESKGGILLSETYINNNTPLDIKCNVCLYEWSPVWGSVQQNHWCPKCSFSKNQKLLTSIMEEIYGEKAEVNYKGFYWLETENGGRQEIDIFLPKSKVGVEYDGEQHFIPIEHWGGKEELEKRKQLDELKNEKIKQHPEDVKYFIRFNYLEPITKEYVLEKLKNKGVI